MFGPILYRIVNVPRKNLSSPADKKSERFKLINFEQQGFVSSLTFNRGVPCIFFALSSEVPH